MWKSKSELGKNIWCIAIHKHDCPNKVEHCWLPTLDYYKDRSSSLVILLGSQSIQCQEKNDHEILLQELGCKAVAWCWLHDSGVASSTRWIQFPMQLLMTEHKLGLSCHGQLWCTSWVSTCFLNEVTHWLWKDTIVISQLEKQKDKWQKYTGS